MNFLQAGRQPSAFISSEQSDHQDLVKVQYTRVQRESPEFHTVYEGIDQSVKGDFSTVTIRAEPEPIIAVYDFIMSTFVPERQAVEASTKDAPPLAVPAIEAPPPQQPQQGDNQQIRVNVNLQGIEGEVLILPSFCYCRTNHETIVILMNSKASIAKLNLSKGDVALLLRGSTLQVKARLEDVSVTDESTSQPNDPEFKKILSREGDHFADFEYETFDPADKENFPGVNSVVKLKTAALKLIFLEQPLHEIYVFLLKLAKLKGLYDAAAQAAVQSVSEITRMRFDALIRSPVVVFPKDALTSKDSLVMRLGEISARNHYDGPKATTEASLQGIGLTSQTFIQGDLSVLKMIEDVHITTTVLQTEGIDHSTQLDIPDIKVCPNTIHHFIQYSNRSTRLKLASRISS
jgi:vacuolar protein sorting-associated protein 13A/C